MGGNSKTPDPLPLVISEDFLGYDPKLFVMPEHYRDSVVSVFIPKGFIQDRIERLALDIFNDVQASSGTGGGGGVECSSSDFDITIVCVLKGAHPFFSELVKQLNKLNATRGTGIRMCTDFVRLKSYIDDRSAGEVQIQGGLASFDKASYRGKNVLIVEDIVDTGKTCAKIIEAVEGFCPRSVAVASLLLKRTPLSSGYVPRHVAFEVPDRFLVGYGTDYNEHFRDLEHLCEINEHGKQKYKASQD